MFAQRNFIACIEGQLDERRFGTKRRGEIVQRFEGLASNFRAQGYGDQIAQSMAMNRVFEELAYVTRERAKRAFKMLEVQAENTDRVRTALGKSDGWLATQFAGVLDGGKGRGAALARAAISLLSSDPRFPGLSAEGWRSGLRDRYWAMMADAIDKFGKGAFGRQKGGAGLYDTVREIFAPGSTKNVEAEAFAKSYGELNTVMVNDRNKAGGSLQHLDKYIPQAQNSVKVGRAGKDKWIADHQQWLDWDKMAWPDGSRIEPGDRQRVLEDVWSTLATDGAHKIDPASFRGRGSAIGNALEDHRFLYYKDADSWIKMHETYGDGTVFDVVAHHVERMAHQTALVQVFGPNPRVGMDNVRAIVRKEAAQLVQHPKTALDRQAVAQADKVIKNRLEPMFQKYTHANSMDANSPWAAGVLTTSNLLTAAKLGSVPFLAAPGDFAQTLAVRMANNFPILSGIDRYVKDVSVGYKDTQKRMAQAGFVFDNAVGAKFTTERFSPLATYGAHFSQVLSDGMIRLSGLNRHTEIARSTAQQEIMAMLWNDIKTPYKDLAYQHVLSRYGIGEKEWDAARKSIAPWTPEPNAEFFRPLDLLDAKLSNSMEMYQRFHSFVSQEANYMVPGATLEADITLTGGMRPDTLIGSVVHSFKMYKNFAITFAHMYGRMALAQERTASKIGFLAAIVGGATVVGALGVQLRELTRGRTPMPMDTASFWGKAFLAGGGASIYGDFLVGSVNQYGHGLASTIAGPLGETVEDLQNVVFGDPFKWVNMWDTGRSDQFKSTFASRLVRFAKMNTPGTSLWQVRLVLERELWDTLDELADPHAHAKQRAKVRRQERQFGNTYWWAPGTGLEGLGG